MAMIEKGTPIEPGNTGDVIATRSAYENDELGNPRVIQRFDFASGKSPSPVPVIRGSGGALNTIDAFDLTDLSTDLTDNLITVGDKSMLVVQVEFSSALADSAVITPILFDNQATPGVIGILPFNVFTLEYPFYTGVGKYLTPLHTWDICGAYKIGLHISEWTSSNSTVYIKVYGWVI